MAMRRTFGKGSVYRRSDRIEAREVRLSPRYTESGISSSSGFSFSSSISSASRFFGIAGK